MINKYSFLNCTKCFIDDGSIFFYLQLLSKYFKTFTGTDKTFALKSKWLSEEIIKTLATSAIIFAPKLTFMTVKFQEKRSNKVKYQLVIKM